MKILIKRSVLFLLTMTLCLSCALAAQAERIFSGSFRAACALTADENTSNSLTVVDDTAFILLKSGDIYTWDPQQDSYTFYVHVATYPLVNVEIPFTRQGEALRAELSDTVCCLIPADDGLYGLNNISGMFGPIDEAGWHVGDVRLDVSMLRSSGDDYPENFRNAFIADGKLYAFHDIDITRGERIGTTLLVFDLSSGACEITALPDTITFCRYAAGQLLCLRDGGSEVPIFAVYDIASKQMTPLELVAPVVIERQLFSNMWHLNQVIGGLCYDGARGSIYLASEEGLWRSTQGAPFELVATPRADDLWESMTSAPEAWVLSSGGYVTQNNWIYYAKP